MLRDSRLGIRSYLVCEKNGAETDRNEPAPVFKLAWNHCLCSLSGSARCVCALQEPVLMEGLEIRYFQRAHFGRDSSSMYFPRLTNFCCLRSAELLSGDWLRLALVRIYCSVFM